MLSPDEQRTPVIAPRTSASCSIPIMGSSIPNMGTQRSSSNAANAAGRTEDPRKTGLADALFSKTQQKVLALLFGNSTRAFFGSEIIKLAESGSGAVQRELARLEQSGLVVSTSFGNRKQYQANSSAPIFDELSSIVAKTFGLAGPLRQALQPLARGIAWAIIYGSVAKKMDTASSDVDVLIVGEGLKLESIFKALAPVERQIQRKINPTILTGSEFRQRLRDRRGFIGRVLDGEYVELMGSRDVAEAAR
jgi:predicted nucleotidyltransferase